MLALRQAALGFLLLGPALAGCVNLSAEERALSHMGPPSLLTCIDEERLRFSASEYQSLAAYLDALRQESKSELKPDSAAGPDAESGPQEADILPPQN